MVSLRAEVLLYSTKMAKAVSNPSTTTQQIYKDNHRRYGKQHGINQKIPSQFRIRVELNGHLIIGNGCRCRHKNKERNQGSTGNAHPINQNIQHHRRQNNQFCPKTDCQRFPIFSGRAQVELSAQQQKGRGVATPAKSIPAV